MVRRRLELLEGLVREAVVRLLPVVEVVREVGVRAVVGLGLDRLVLFLVRLMRYVLLLGRGGLLLLRDDRRARTGTGHRRWGREEGEFGRCGRRRAALGRVPHVVLPDLPARVGVDAAVAGVVPLGGTGRAHLDAVEDVWVLFRYCPQQLRQRFLLLQTCIVARVVVFQFSGKKKTTIIY